MMSYFALVCLPTTNLPLSHHTNRLLNVDIRPRPLNRASILPKNVTEYSYDNGLLSSTIEKIEAALDTQVKHLDRVEGTAK